MWAVYGSFALMVWLGTWLRSRRRLQPIAGATLAGSVLFFVVTNFAVWLSGMTYPTTAVGLLACYVAAIPYFGNTIAGDAFYAALLFGGFALAERHFRVLRPPHTIIHNEP
jgi:ABC-type multidrug transport system fused ATPase/permease subunit